MALQKEIELENGIIIDYHRIITLQMVTNKSIDMIVGSYVNKENRNKDFLDNKIIQTKVYTTEYEEDYNIEKAYEYLKTLPEFENAIDV
jgi:hypothetical protein